MTRLMCFVVALSLPALASAQTVWQPSAAPVATADSQPWYAAGDPIVYAGDTYYRAGATVFFNAYQMVRSGYFRGIPLYVDTTLEPYSLVFVPVAGGMMQPYERRRTGQLAGTTGSTVPSFPPDVATEGMTGATATTIPTQAPGPPVRARDYEANPTDVQTPVPETAVSTTGTVASPGGLTPEVTIGGQSRAQPRVSARPRPSDYTLSGSVRTATGRRTKIGRGTPLGINAVWVNYDGRRWFAAGPTVDLKDGGFTQIGSYHGSPVYVREAEPGTIYIPSVPGLLAPFKTK